MRIFVYFFFLFFTLSLFGQKEKWSFKSLSLDKGLSNTFVNDILKDSKGYVWIATANGLNRFNAYDIESFYNDPEDDKSLSSDDISCLFEDSKNRLWVGTDNGLNLYDRKTGEFIRFVPDTVHSKHSVPRTIIDIVEDENGMLWIGAWGDGAVMFDAETNKFTHFLPREEKGHYTFPKYIRTLLIDDQNQLWIGTNGAGVTRYSIDTKDLYSWNVTIDDQIKFQLSFCFDLFQDSDGGIWAGTFVGGLMKFDSKLNNFRLIENPYNPIEQTKNGIMSISEDKGNILTLGSNGGGLFLFDRKEEKFISNYKYQIGNPGALSSDFVINQYRDENEVLWMGTENGGVSIYDPNRSKFKLYTKDGEDGLPGNVINAIYEANDGILWIGTENNGFASLDRDTWTYQYYNVPNVQRDKNNTFVKTITEDENGNILVGANMGGLLYMSPERKVIGHYPKPLTLHRPFDLHDHDLRTILVDKDGRVWGGTTTGLFEKMDTIFRSSCLVSPERVNKDCVEPVNKIFELDKDHLLVGYRNYGLRIYDKKSMSIVKQFKADYANKNALSSKLVNDIYKDSKGRIWIATKVGLNLFNLKDSTFQRFLKKDGLPDNIVLGILEDNQGKLWVSTSNGLSCFDTENKSFTNYFEEDGIQSNVFRRGATFKSKSGELFFGGVGGFNSFYPEDLKSNPYPPQIVLTKFQLFNKPVEVGADAPLKIKIEETKEIILNYDQDVISFEFAALNYTNTEMNEYAYKLEGFDVEWHYIGRRRHISFTNLPPGEYTLRIKACNNDGVWNEEGISLRLIINPPFWMTWWFRTLVVLIVLFGIYFLYRLRVRSIKLKNKLLEETVVKRTAEVVHQKEIVEQKNKDMLDSIRYSKRIQDSFLPHIEDYQSNFSSTFVYYKPKDIVSGDFYWMEESADYLFFAVADCTGHGVPGAMVSVLGNNGLKRCVKEMLLVKPNEILDNLSTFVEQSLDKKDSKVMDGLDIAFCVYNKKEKTIEYSGANNPLWLLREGAIIEYKADKQPIGKYSKRMPFNSNKIELQKGDWIFVFSDGFPDQFGGPKNKKYRYSRMRDFLTEMNKENQKQMESDLDAEFTSWKGEHEQIDDVCVMGIQFF